MNTLRKHLPPYRLFLVIVALSALGAGMYNEVLSNYFKEVYNVDAYVRGLIEFPRELPGVLTILFIAFLSRFSDIRISLVAQLLSLIGCITLGLVTPPFGIMLIFVFIYSAGAHLNMPLQESIGMSLMQEGSMGTQMGQYKGIATAFAMVASAVVFVGFRWGLFSLATHTKWIFVVGSVFMAIAVGLILLLDYIVHKPIKSDKRIKFIFRKKYNYYYTLVVMFGLQKQIMLVYGPWVLIDLLGKKADTIAMLGILGSFVGMFFMPALGRWIDRFGIKKLLYADAYSFIGVYLAYGLLTAAFVEGWLPMAGIPLLLAYSLFITDRMSNQMGMIRTLYLRKIAEHPSDIMPTLSLGLSMDHVVSIICAFLGGIIWSTWGPQYIFFFTAAVSFVNVYVAHKVRIE